MGEDEWNARKYGGSKRSVWRKIHIGIYEKTLEVRAAEFTTSGVGYAPMLLDQIPPRKNAKSWRPDTACQRQSKSEPKGSAKCCHFGVGEIAA